MYNKVKTQHWQRQRRLVVWMRVNVSLSRKSFLFINDNKRKQTINISGEDCDVLGSDASATKPTATEMPFTYLTSPESFAAIRNVVKTQTHPLSHCLPTHPHTETHTYQLQQSPHCVVFCWAIVAQAGSNFTPASNRGRYIDKSERAIQLSCFMFPAGWLYQSCRIMSLLLVGGNIKPIKCQFFNNYEEDRGVCGAVCERF